MSDIHDKANCDETVSDTEAVRPDLNWFDRLLCRLGIHEWMTDTRYAFRDPPVPAFCYRCHKHRGGYGE